MAQTLQYQQACRTINLRQDAPSIAHNLVKGIDGYGPKVIAHSALTLMDNEDPPPPPNASSIVRETCCPSLCTITHFKSASRLSL
jgi:hypothetical protein